MYQRIVVPIDNSDTATAAFEHALALAKLAGSRIHLVHVEDVSRPTVAAAVLPGLEIPKYNEQRQVNINHSLGLLEHLAHDAAQASVPCSTQLIEQWGGNPADTLLKAAADFDADLIVMGTHGYSGFMRLIFGSVAESLLHHTTIPVLMLKKPNTDES